ncbi:hypothetical protein Sjap_021515 [Stephania japonica]|uniref:BHLH domain-containing protein n=1 Tax=Stephania japonica TaxID=461633 RepID=A0AAP0ESR9_9MAGN
MANYVNHQSYASNKGRPGGGIANNNIKPPHASQDHIIAERKRREKLSQRFIALSAIVPNLKKVDALEDKLAKKSTVVESAIFVKKSLLILDELKNNGSSHNSSNKDDDESNNVDHWQQPLPEIEVRVCGKNVLIRIHCDKNKCVLVNALSLLEDNLNLTVTNSNLMPFADSSLHITIVAQASFCCRKHLELTLSSSEESQEEHANIFFQHDLKDNNQLRDLIQEFSEGIQAIDLKDDYSKYYLH